MFVAYLLIVTRDLANLSHRYITVVSPNFELQKGIEMHGIRTHTLRVENPRRYQLGHGRSLDKDSNLFGLYSMSSHSMMINGCKVTGHSMIIRGWKVTGDMMIMKDLIITGHYVIFKASGNKDSATLWKPKKRTTLYEVLGEDIEQDITIKWNWTRWDENPFFCLIILVKKQQSKIGSESFKAWIRRKTWSQREKILIMVELKSKEETATSLILLIFCSLHSSTISFNGAEESNS